MQKMQRALKVSDIPLDAWVVILRHIDRHNLVRVFDDCFDANVFGIDKKDRMNTFWIVMAQARLLDQEEMPVFDIDPTPYVSTRNRLLDFGLPPDRVAEVVRQSQGDFDVALHLLGWD